MASNSPQKRVNLFSRGASPAIIPANVADNKPTSPRSHMVNSTSHHVSGRESLIASPVLNQLQSPNTRKNPHQRSNSRNVEGSSTFAPSFIKTDSAKRDSSVVKGIEGENDFSGKRYVWVKDPVVAFVKGWVVETLTHNQILVQCEDGSVGLIATIW